MFTISVAVRVINYPFRNSISTEDSIFRHDTTGSAEHWIMQTKRFTKAGLEVDHTMVDQKMVDR